MVYAVWEKACNRNGESIMNWENKKILLIYNPRAGMNARRPKAREILDEMGALAAQTDVAATAYPGHAKEIATKTGANYDVVICCGGDGTLNEVINGLKEAGCSPEIGYIPTGSTNDFASNMSIPKKMPQAVAVIKEGNVNACDCASFNDRSFTYIASFGPGVAVSYSTPQGVKNMIGYSAYMINGFGFQTIPTMRALKPKHIKVEYDGSTLEDDFYFGTVSNTLSAAGLFKFSEDEVRFNDGRFEVVLIRRMKNPMQMFSLLVKMRRHEYDGDMLVHFRASHLKFTFEKEEVWTLDGESSGKVKDVEIIVKQEEIKLLCPDSVYFEKREQ